MSLQDNLESEDQNDAPEEQQTPGYGGFLELITAPMALGASQIRRPGAIIATAIIIYALSFSFSQIITFSSPELVEQQKKHEISMVQKFGVAQGLTEEGLQAQIDGISEKWEDPIHSGSIALGLASGFGLGLVYIFFFGGVFWIFVRLLVESPPGYINIATLVAYGAGIAALQMIISALMAAIGGSLMFTPSPSAIFADPSGELQSTTALLGLLNLFDIWKYIAVGIAVAAHSGLTKGKGILFGAIAFIIVFAFFAGLALIGMMMTGATG